MVMVMATNAPYGAEPYPIVVPLPPDSRPAGTKRSGNEKGVRPRGYRKLTASGESDADARTTVGWLSCVCVMCDV